MRGRVPRAALLCVVLLVAACARVRTEGNAIAVTGPLPDLSATLVGGGTLDTSGFEGRVVVVNFWATWCGPCRREQPILESVFEDTRGGGPVFVGVNYRDDDAAAAAYLEEFGVGYPSVADPAGTLAFRFGVPYLPATYVAGPDGQLRFRVVGEIDRATLEDLIARAAA